MKKKNILILAIVALLFTLVGYGIATITGPDRSAGAATEPTQAVDATVPAEGAVATPVFEDGCYTFTAAEFRERFGTSLPNGYSLGDAVVSNPSRHDKLQISILNAAGEDTGIAVLFNVKSETEVFGKIALTAGIDDNAEDYAALAEWYIGLFLPGFSAKDKAAMLEEFLELFTSKQDDYIVKAADEAVAMMVLEQEDSGDQYYIVIAIN